MSSAAQIRSSVNRWLGAVLPVNSTLDPADRIAYQGIQGQQGNEWHIAWDSERKSSTDQHFSRLFQIVRCRQDGDEVALETELAAALTAMDLTIPGLGEAVTVYDYPTRPTVAIGTAIVRRQNGVGWAYLPDPGVRPGHLRAVITLQVDYRAG